MASEKPDTMPDVGGQQTPAQPVFFQPDTSRSLQQVVQETESRSGQDAPTKVSFGGLSEQRPLPTQPIVSNAEDVRPTSSASPLDRTNSLKSAKSAQSGDSEDVTMEDEEGDEEESDDASATSTSPKTSKKKKGQRFFCTDYPPCQLSFTRSEHLARHIRKHTGERPFQCHCSRRFSRLDNLRQHAQTVHVNEDIPVDSLAATGTRFQRQIRTDRVRPPNRPRPSSLTPGTPSRGHSRNVSTSSIASTASSLGSPEDYRRRPPPLAMARTPTSRPGLSLETYHSSAGSPNTQYQQYYNRSPGGFTTPTSTTFSHGASSPRTPSALQSPISIPRALTWSGGTAHHRRLSVPSVPISFQAHPSQVSYPAPYMTSIASSTGSTFSNSPSSLASPTGSVFSDRSRDYNADAVENRRRTWHPTTVSGLSGRPATSGLSYYQTPDSPRPVAANQPAAAQAVRLPPIESFDRAPPRRPPSAEPLEDPQRPMTSSGASKRRPSESQWDAMNQNLTRLDLANATPPHYPSAWRYSPGSPHRPISFGAAQPSPTPTFVQPSAPPSYHPPTIEPHPKPTEEPTTPRKKKREAWYMAPLATSQEPQNSFPLHRTSPEDSSSSDGVPTPSTTSTGDYRPAIVHSNGFIETSSPDATVEDTQKAYVHSAPQVGSHSLPPADTPMPTGTPGQQTPRAGPDMNRLDALAAVATSADHSRNASLPGHA